MLPICLAMYAALLLCAVHAQGGWQLASGLSPNAAVVSGSPVVSSDSVTLAWTTYYALVTMSFRVADGQLLNNVTEDQFECLGDEPYGLSFGAAYGTPQAAGTLIATLMFVNEGNPVTILAVDAATLKLKWNYGCAPYLTFVNTGLFQVAPQPIPGCSGTFLLDSVTGKQTCAPYPLSESERLVCGVNVASESGVAALVFNATRFSLVALPSGVVTWTTNVPVAGVPQWAMASQIGTSLWWLYFVNTSAGTLERVDVETGAVSSSVTFSVNTNAGIGYMFAQNNSVIFTDLVSSIVAFDPVTCEYLWSMKVSTNYSYFVASPLGGEPPASVSGAGAAAAAGRSGGICIAVGTPAISCFDGASGAPSGSAIVPTGAAVSNFVVINSTTAFGVDVNQNVFRVAL